MRIEKSACWVFAGLMSVTHGVYAQEKKLNTYQNKHQGTTAEIQKSITLDTSEKSVQEAEEQMKMGNPDEAYNLLEPLEFDRAGEVRFDYLIGIAALDSGKPDKATLAFERVLAVDPDYVGARLDMARAYYQLGDMPRAKTEFETVLKQNPSAAARVTIQKYLDSMAEPETEKQTHISGYVEGTMGRDNNVNNASAQAPVASSGNLKRADYYYGVAAGSEADHHLNANWGMYAGANFRQRGHKTQKSFDSLSLDGRIGVTYTLQANQIRMGVLGGSHIFGSARDRNTAGLNAEWRRAIGANDQLSVFGQYVQYRYADAAMKLNDINQQAVDIGWLHLLEGAKAAVSGSLYYGTEKDVGPMTPSNLNGGRTDGAKRFAGFRLGGQTAFGEKTKLFISAGEQVGNYKQVNPLILNTRTDRQYDLALGVNWYWDALWAVRPQLAYFSNHSNISSYNYSRTDASLTIRRNFK